MPVRASEEESTELEVLAEHLLRDAGQGAVRLTDALGHELAVPESVMKVLPELVRQLALGSAVVVVPLHAELTTQQAADFLNVSRPFVVKLVDSKELPATKVGTHRRIKFSDLLAYKTRHQMSRLDALRRMTAESESRGLGY
ncbi:MAG TPA: helix-turn-helix domain-containing protein, partial [Acidimicrobiia bacterium]|nr:helix-turn-helix domain-containing protein [Acidimicrobiia bacterium]